MSAYSTGFLFADESTCSAEDSPASQSAKQGLGLGQTTLASSGRISLESFERFNRASSWAKTFAACLLATPLYSSACVLTWRLRATTYSRCYFQLRALARPITETGSGLLPTPVAGMDQQSATYVGGNLTLKGALLPTPAASNFNDGESLESWQARQQRLKAKHNNGNGMGMPLGIAAKLLRTPMASDGETGYQGTNRVGRQLNLPTQLGGSLNPRFVAQMMGFPPDWCELPAPAPSS